MKVHYINIFLLALPLNILDHSKNKQSIIRRHTQTTRLLCECELYAPANYDNDQEMKSVMDNFNKHIQQRFHEYDDRMIEKRQKCKEQWDKEIQKIILKDKLEKQMEQQLTTLETKITTNDIPTCVCEKSLADKVEKECLKCTQNLGGIVAPCSGVLTGIAEGALYAWKPTALKIAIDKAITSGAADILAAAETARIQTGVNTVIAGLKALNIDELGFGTWESIVTTKNYNNVTYIANIIIGKRQDMCGWTNILDATTCNRIGITLGTVGENNLPDIIAIPQKIKPIVSGAEKTAEVAADTAKETITAEITARETGVINTIFMGKQTAIIASIVTIVVIILIMVILYLILRYRKKKKMKKKIQYIKLLEE
ncbi:PIR protein, putative [Plasmodium sp.]|nr:PIR protein, putative [Plasmodium sp.]